MTTAMKEEEINFQFLNSRRVGKRVFVTGELELRTPAGLGNGDVDPDQLTNIPLMRDPVDNRPILTGTSIAGAIRNYLLAAEKGFGVTESGKGLELSASLFGYVNDNKAGNQQATFESWLMVDDAYGTLPLVKDSTLPIEYEVRDGVTIDPVTRTAVDKQLYSYELLPAGTVFNVSFELWVPNDENKAGELLQAFADGLYALGSEEIGLGLRKSRGLGRCRLTQSGWQVCVYDMTKPADVIGWLEHDSSSLYKQGKDLHNLLGLPNGPTVHNGEQFEIEATFSLRRSLLIRAASTDPNAPDDVYLRSARGGENRPILSGTSIAGAIRARALRIAKTMQLGDEIGLIDQIFGNKITPGDNETQPSGSRMIIHESEFDTTKAILGRVQSRVKIDRFTSGAFPTALFSQQPLFARSDGGTEVTLHLILRNYQSDNRDKHSFEDQVKLILMVIKDLWCADLPLGGEASVGRGRFNGVNARLIHRKDGGCTEWAFSADSTRPNGGLVWAENSADPNELQKRFDPKQIQHEEG